jgi:hypothetical protein
MIRIKPDIDLTFDCPCGKSAVRPDALHLGGMHTIAHFRCAACDEAYFLEMPINAGGFYPGILNARTGERADRLPLDNWYLRGLVDAYRQRKSTEIGFEIEKNRAFSPGKKIALLHCLDTTYGHALFELFNADHYLAQPDVDLIIIVQKNLRWLVPDGAAEVWVLDIPFSRANDWNEWLAERVREEVSRLPGEVHLCRTFVQADSSDFDIERYSRVKPFPLDEWDARLVKPTVTFIWRTDRFWRKVLPLWLDNRVTRRFFPKIIENIRHHYQTRWMLRFAEALRRAVPNLDFAIAGMDERSPKFPDWIQDYRQPRHDDDQARAQCRRYAESHLVMGCNGSSLILPGCHSGAMLDIVPGDQWAVSAGSFAFRKTDFGDTHFRYTLVPAEVTIPRLVSITVSMLRDRSYVQLQASPPWRDHDADLPPFATAAQRVKSHELSEHFNTKAGLVTLPRKVV